MCSSFSFVFTAQSQLISDNKCQKAKDLPICVDNASFLDPYLLHIWLVIDFRSNLVLISMTTLSEVSKLLEALLLLHFHFRAILNPWHLCQSRQLCQIEVDSMIHVLHLAWAPHGNFVTFLESLSPLICTKMKVEFSPWQLCHIFGVFVTFNLHEIWPMG